MSQLNVNTISPQSGSSITLDSTITVSGNITATSQTGSIGRIEGDTINLSGDLIANRYIVSSSITELSVITNSGSTAFGDSLDDTHTYTGSLQLTGSITATSFSGDGSNLTNVFEGTAPSASISTRLTSFTDGTATLVSGSATSTGSFGHLKINNTDVIGTTNGIAIGGGTNFSSPSLAFEVTKQIDNNYVALFRNIEADAGRNFGLYVRAGSNTSDFALQIRNKDDSLLTRVDGTGNLLLNAGDVRLTSGNVSGSATSTGSFGMIGVGIANPDEELHVENGNIKLGDSTNTARHMRFERNGTFVGSIGTNNSMLSLIGGTGTGTNGLNVHSSGQVSIGSVTPDALLHLYSAATPEIRIQDSTNDSIIEMQARDNDTRLGTTSNHPLDIRTNDISAIYIDVSQNVTASANLEIAGNISGSATSTGSFGHLKLGNVDTDAIFEFGRAHIGHIGFSDMAGFSHVDHDGTGTFALAQSNLGKTIVQAASGQPISFKIGGSDKVQINSSGDLGVGIETALHKLHVVGDGFFTGNVSGSATSTGSFGKLLGDGSSLTGITSFAGSAGTETSFSGSAASTGSFGRGFIDDKLSVNCDPFEPYNLTVKGGDSSGGAFFYAAQTSDQYIALIPRQDFTMYMKVGYGLEIRQNQVNGIQGDFSVSQNGTKRFLIKASSGATHGFVGINETSPTEQLHVDGNILSTGNIVAEGNITAQNFIVSSSVTSITYQSLSGSTIFGDTADDTHEFIGNTISGSAGSTGSFGRVETAKDLNVSGFTTLGNGISSNNGNFTISTSATEPALDIKSNGTSTIKLRTGANSYISTGNDNTAFMLGTTGNQAAKFAIYAPTTSVHRYGMHIVDQNGSVFAVDIAGNITASANISSSATSTGSFGKLLGDGSSLTGITSFAGSAGTETSFSGSAASTGSFGGLTLTNVNGDVAIRTNYTGGANVIIGDASTGENITTGGDNVVIGRGISAITGENNVYIGASAAGSNATPNNCVAIGFGAMSGGTANERCVAVGMQTLNGSGNGFNNSAFGHQAGKNTTSGEENAFFGYLSGDTNTTGDKNVTLGAGADVSTTGAQNQIAIGHNVTSTGDNQTVIGNSDQTHVVFGGSDTTLTLSGSMQISGSGPATSASLHIRDFSYTDTHILSESLVVAVDGNNGRLFSVTDQMTGSLFSANTVAGLPVIEAFSDNKVTLGPFSSQVIVDSDGNISGSATSTGSFGTIQMPGISIGNGTNTFFGKDAGKVHGNNGANNLAIGLNAMDDTDAGSTSLSSDENVFIGHNAGGGTWANNKSRFNTGVGNNSMAAAFNAALSNTALGYNSLNKLTEGDSNIAMGSQAGEEITTGEGNTCLGTGAGKETLADGDDNVLVGRNVDTSAAGSANQIVIGVGITAAGDNDFAFGKASNVVHNDFDADAAWSRTSDIRKKRNIQEDKLGLEFINKLKPVTHQWKPSNEFPKEWKEYNEENQMNLDVVIHNMIAQDVKKALDEVGCDTFGGWKEREDGSQTISREMFVTPLINAVKELSEQNKELEKRIQELENKKE